MTTRATPAAPNSAELESAFGETLEEVLSRAIACHRAGNLSQAERLYRSILSASPGHPDANHNLGVLAVATGHPAAALAHFQAALAANPKQSQYWLSCIDALIQAGQRDAARKMLQHGVRSGLSGQAAESLQRRLSVATSIQTTPITAKRNRRRKPPDGAPLAPTAEHTGLLLALFSQRRFAEAEALAISLTTRFPSDGFAWKALGVMLQQQGKRREALEAKQRSAALLPGDAEAQSNLGNAFLKLSRYDEAAACYRLALSLRPGYAEAWSNLGITLQKLGRLADAEAHCRRALELRPVYADASSNLGIILQEGGRLAEAEASYRAALAIDPNHADAWNNLGITLQKQVRLAEAELAHRHAIELKQDYADAYTNLAGCLQQQARLAEAEACYRRAIALDPEQANSFTNLLFCLSHDLKTTPEALFAEHLRFAAHFEAPLRPTWRPHPNSRDPERVIRIGFVSADLREHALSHFLEPLCHLDQFPGLAIHIYANHVLEDRQTERLKHRLTNWRQIVGLSDAALADAIRADAIDLLVDLSGHTGGNRLLTFARKPAPVQCGWIGYLGTSGMQSMDYYLADDFFLPPGEFDCFFTERLFRVPVIASFQADACSPSINPLPALENGYVTFGSFSRTGKIGPEVVALWSRLLRASPGSTMLLGAMPRDGRYEPLAGWFAKEGISGKRLRFHLGMGLNAYLELHHQVDICLDPFPFAGATTTCHAMWMGVPTLTLAGRTPSGRLGPALLRHAGLGDFVCTDHDDFVARGLDHARDWNRLAALRSGLRERFLASPLSQHSMVAKGLADAFREMWRAWCHGKEITAPYNYGAGTDPRSKANGDADS